MGAIGHLVSNVLSPVTHLLGLGGGTSTVNVENPVKATDLVSSTSSETPEAATVNIGSSLKKKGKSALTISTGSGGGNYTGLNI